MDEKKKGKTTEKKGKLKNPRGASHYSYGMRGERTTRGVTTQSRVTEYKIGGKKKRGRPQGDHSCW